MSEIDDISLPQFNAETIIDGKIEGSYCTSDNQVSLPTLATLLTHMRHPDIVLN